VIESSDEFLEVAQALGGRNWRSRAIVRVEADVVVLFEDFPFVVGEERTKLGVT